MTKSVLIFIIISKYLLTYGVILLKKSEKTKAKILKTTIELVAKKGYAATSTKEIAEQSGISEATIFKYFGSKNELLKKIVLNTIDKFQDYSLNNAIPETIQKHQDEPVPVLLKAIIKERFSFFEKNTNAIQVIFQEMLINEEVREIFKEKIWDNIIKISDEIINRGKANQEIKPIDNYVIRKVLLGILFGEIIENQLQLNGKPNYNSEQQLQQLIEILYQGIKEE